MKLLSIMIAFLLCASCVRSHDFKPAHLEFVSIENRERGVFYEVRFTSDIELLELYWREKGAGRSGQIFICALADDTDFSVEHTIAQFGVGLVRRDEEYAGRDGFGYVADISFEETRNKRTTSVYLDKKVLAGLLASKKAIPCKVVATASGYKPYYTESLYIPTGQILEEMHKRKDG
ncbi:hypothetical protein [Pseudomonas purpurea]|uniref:hypothetical protein n=1 Tax=Pseudomonas purpurea TaxID=3136737 RepID=UPI003266A522